jgi:hypothetical protein
MKVVVLYSESSRSESDRQEDQVYSQPISTIK